MSNIKISLLDYSESKLITEFYNLFHSKKGRDESKFKWEFENSPYQQSIYIVAKDITTGKIVGSQAAIPLEVIDGNGIVTLTAKSEDTIVHPDYRGQNIFENMYKLLFEECSKRGIKIIWGFTTAKKPFTKLGFDTPYSISQCLAVFSLTSSIKYLKEYNPTKGVVASIKTIGLCFLGLIKSSLFHISKNNLKDSSCSLTIKPVNLDNSKLIQNVLSESKDHFFIKQDSTYLNWRLSANPYHKDLVCVDFIKNNLAIAQIIFNHHEDGVWYLIQDIYSVELSPIHKTIILKQAIAALRKSKQVNLIRTWDFMHNKINQGNVEAKKNAGFYHLNKGSLFVWKLLDQKVGLKSNNFILSRIASEGTI